MTVSAILLAGGLGTRLHPLTEALPKPMLPILGRPWLERLVDHLADQGIRDVILSLRHGKDVILRHFRSPEWQARRTAGEPPRLRFAVEPVPLGTGGALRYAAWPAGGTVLAFNADVVQAFALPPFLAFHRRRRAEVTIGLVEVDDPGAYGAVELDDHGRVLRFVEKPAPGQTAGRLVNAGVYAIEPEVLAAIPAGREVSLEREVFPALLRRGARVFGYRFEGYWRDIGTRDRYLELHRDILRGRCPIRPDLPERSPGVWVAHDARVAPGALLEPPVVVGPGTVVEDGAQLGPWTVAGRDCRVAGGSQVVGSVLWDGAAAERGAVISGCVVAAGARIGGGRLEDALVSGRWAS